MDHTLISTLCSSSSLEKEIVDSYTREALFRSMTSLWGDLEELTLSHIKEWNLAEERKKEASLPKKPTPPHLPAPTKVFIPEPTRPTLNAIRSSQERLHEVLKYAQNSNQNSWRRWKTSMKASPVIRPNTPFFENTDIRMQPEREPNA